MAVQADRSCFSGEPPKVPPVGYLAGRNIPGLSILVAGLFLLDIISTHAILLTGGMELNPLMAGIVTSPFVHLAIKAATLLLIIIVSLVAEKKVQGSSVGFYYVIIILYIFVIVNNVFVLIPHAAGF